MRLMNYYYNDYRELYTRSINQLHHKIIEIIRKLIRRLKQVTLGLKVTNGSVELILRHLKVKLPFCPLSRKSRFMLQ